MIAEQVRDRADGRNSSEKFDKVDSTNSGAQGRNVCSRNRGLYSGLELRRKDLMPRIRARCHTKVHIERPMLPGLPVGLARRRSRNGDRSPRRVDMLMPLRERP